MGSISVLAPVHLNKAIMKTTATITGINQENQAVFAVNQGTAPKIKNGGFNNYSGCGKIYISSNNLPEIPFFDKDKEAKGELRWFYGFKKEGYIDGDLFNLAGPCVLVYQDGTTVKGMHAAAFYRSSYSELEFTFH